MAYRLFAFLPNSSQLTFEKLVSNIKEKFIKDSSVKITTKKRDLVDVLRLEWSDFFLTLGYQTKPNRDEIEEIVETYAKKHPEREKILKSQLVLTLESGDDFEMNYFNDYVFVCEVLYEILGIILWNPDSLMFVDSGTGEEKKYY